MRGRRRGFATEEDTVTIEARRELAGFWSAGRGHAPKNVRKTAKEKGRRQTPPKPAQRARP